MCLVVSVSPQRSQLLVRAAHQEHWATIVCRSAEEAARQAVRNRIQLALVDMQSVPVDQEHTFRTFVEQLAARDGPLVAVCGKPNDALGEVWSRQLGVWMYLPGVDSESDLALVCGEARSIVEKLWGRAPEHVT
jgi:DNA-binding response OmpR family regulator